MGFFDRLLRTGEGKKLRALKSLVPDIGAFEPEMQELSDAELRSKTAEFRQRLDRGEELDYLLIEAFATVREAAVRVLGQRHFDVQLMGAAALHFGWVAEMKTGEGKTLVSTMPVYLNALSGQGVHVVTVNDYLASFQSEWMGRLYHFLGLDVGLIIPGRNDADHKRAQYACDVTYGTNNEFGFDYLRDNMAMSRERQVKRGHHYAIVDEVDSILIDEARTPLIISGKMSEQAKVYTQFAQIVRTLRRDEHYEVDEEKRTVVPTEEGIEKVEASLGLDNLYDAVSQNLVHQFQVALKAKELYKRDKDYIVADGEVKIVDEFTGRVLDGRRWSEGLHQAVEAKEGVPIKDETQTLATVTLQNYFRLYDKLAGMTGTATTEAAEFASTYGLDVVPIPTNQPVIRDDRPDLIYKSEQGKFGAVVDDLAERYETGQPVLVGTISVEKSELLSRMLTKQGVPHEVLNAKPDRHAKEGEIVAQAGRLHAITVATNMAGRGVDIILGGNPELLAKKDLRQRELDPDDPENEAELVAATERFTTETRAEGEKVKDLGGLYVLGTERHDSRRIDNQLRGRSGRQGDPGESRFYLSLEDDLMRLFATGMVSSIMNKSMPDDVPLETKMVTKAIERAQNTVEQRNAERRKNVLKYDEVMNEQRKVIYAMRDQILDEADLRSRIVEEYLPETVDHVVAIYCDADFAEEWDLDGLLTEIGSYWPTELAPDQLAACATSDEVFEALVDEAIGYYEQRETEIGPELMRQVERQVMLRIIDQKWREHLAEMDYLQDGINLRAMGQKDPLTEWQREGFEMFGQMVEHVKSDFLRYALHVDVKVQRPEGGDGDGDDAATVSDVSYSQPGDPDDSRAKLASAAAASAAGGERPEPSEPDQNAPIVKSDWEKTGRNEPCPCGSGKKFKHCHGR